MWLLFYRVRKLLLFPKPVLFIDLYPYLNPQNSHVIQGGDENASKSYFCVLGMRTYTAPSVELTQGSDVT